MDNTRQMLKSIAVLSAISLIAGLLLALFYQLTFVSAEELKQRNLAKLARIYPAKFEEVETELNDGISGIYKAEDEDFYIILAQGKGFKDTLELYVGFRGTEIELIKVGKNSDTPGIKEKAFKDEYLSQYYVDINNAAFVMGQDVDSAAGATYTSGGVLQAVKAAVLQYKMYIENKTKEEIMLGVMQTIRPSENGYTSLPFVKGGIIQGFFKEKDEDYYFVITKNNGYGEGLILYISISSQSIVNIYIDENNNESDWRSGVQTAFSQDYLNRYYVSVNNAMFKRQFDKDVSVDGISGATKTANAIFDAVKAAATLYKTYTEAGE